MTDWLHKLQAQANQSPALARVPFYVENMKIGSVEPVFMHDLRLLTNKYKCSKLLKEEQSGWHLVLGQSDVTSALNQLAGVLRDAGLAGAWRDEQLAVHDQQGVQIGTIERGAVRPLGIATLAVHLVGQTTDGRFWVQQRALNKANDPGKWDTLMGGMVSADDTLETALQRETWEEAGLHIADLQGLHYAGRQSNCRPTSDGAAGYMQEFIEWYVATLPDGMTPINQDGEVAQFMLMDQAQLLAAMQRGDFTLEAALMMAGVLGLLADQSISSPAS
jgi:8-oxo-dGTP pyrophosphatase MutT (NUDIX family)